MKRFTLLMILAFILVSCLPRRLPRVDDLLIGGVVTIIALWFALIAAVNRAAEKRRYRQ